MFKKFVYLVVSMVALHSIKASACNQEVDVSRIECLTGICDGACFIHFTNSDVDDNEAIVIAKSIANNERLASLDLIENRIGDVGAIALAKALERSKILTTVVLSRNKITDEGGRAFLLLLDNKILDNSGIRRIDLTENEVSKDVISSVNIATERNKNMKISKSLFAFFEGAFNGRRDALFNDI